MEDGNEIYCRWCGEGDGELILCDVCPKGFCQRCITNNFGTAELERIKSLSDRWCCFVCSPQSFRDLCVKNGWKGTQTSEIKTPFNRGVCHDISRGREKFEIPVINEIDYANAPLDFNYVSQPVAGEGAKLSNNPNFLSCCSCTDDCSNPLTCQCIINSGGISYDATGRLMLDKPSGIYECNYRCACHVKRCRNRVVSNGPSVRLEVFRCANPKKGWGVRSRQPILPGTFIADYCGEIMPESEAERRGLSHSDEYLYSIDCWGRSKACSQLSQLGLKRSLSALPREYFVDVTSMGKESLMQYLDPSIVNRLEQHGAIDRMLEDGKKLREKEKRMKKQSEDTRRELLQQRRDSLRQQLSQEQGLTVPPGALSAADEEDDYKGIDFSAPFYSDGSPEKVSGKRQAAGRNLMQSSTLSNKKAKGSNNNKAFQSKFKKAMTTTQAAPADREEPKREVLPASWYELRLKYSQREWTKARAVIVDRCVVETDDKNDSFIIDARWYGSIGRFLNHSCNPNLDILMVFCDTHDVRRPRVAFFANDHIPANTELCYDYGYFPGNVDGKHRTCLCNAPNCRKTLY